MENFKQIIVLISATVNFVIKTNGFPNPTKIGVINPNVSQAKAKLL